jgi:hypothetical protein
MEDMTNDNQQDTSGICEEDAEEVQPIVASAYERRLQRNRDYKRRVRDRKNLSEKRLTRKYNSDPYEVGMRRILCGIINRASGELLEHIHAGIERALLEAPEEEPDKFRPIAIGFNYGNDGFYIVRYMRPDDGSNFYARAASVEEGPMTEFDETITEADLERLPPRAEDIRR